jgi:hypothetical protein
MKAYLFFILLIALFWTNTLYAQNGIVNYYFEYDKDNLQGIEEQRILAYKVPDTLPYMRRGFKEIIVPDDTLTLFEWFEWPARRIPPRFKRDRPPLENIHVAENPGFITKTVYKWRYDYELEENGWKIESMTNYRGLKPHETSDQNWEVVSSFDQDMRIPRHGWTIQFDHWVHNDPANWEYTKYNPSIFSVTRTYFYDDQPIAWAITIRAHGKTNRPLEQTIYVQDNPYGVTYDYVQSVTNSPLDQISGPQGDPFYADSRQNRQMKYRFNPNLGADLSGADFLETP